MDTVATQWSLELPQKWAVPIAFELRDESRKIHELPELLVSVASGLAGPGSAGFTGVARRDAPRVGRARNTCRSAGLSSGLGARRPLWRLARREAPAASTAQFAQKWAPDAPKR
jgi:hypothetical protein